MCLYRQTVHKSGRLAQQLVPLVLAPVNPLAPPTSDMCPCADTLSNLACSYQLLEEEEVEAWTRAQSDLAPCQALASNQVRFAARKVAQTRPYCHCPAGVRALQENGQAGGDAGQALVQGGRRRSSASRPPMRNHQQRRAAGRLQQHVATSPRLYFSL